MMEINQLQQGKSYHKEMRQKHAEVLTDDSMRPCKCNVTVWNFDTKDPSLTRQPNKKVELQTGEMCSLSMYALCEGMY